MDFYDVSEWTELSASSTKGTRDKLVLAGSSEDTYFLKFPMVREKRDYTPENWSEILAYEIGTQLGFNVLRYDLAIHNGRIGCISKNMITPSKNESLVEGHQILSRYDSTYDPSNKNSYSRYTFGFVQEALKAYDAAFYIEDFIRTLIFDAIIGNSDRHQSNWGIILSTKIEDNNISIIKKAAPIYDSGCCLEREFGEEQIQMHLDIQSKFDKYIRNGVSELRTKKTSNKSSHEELLKFIKGVNNDEWNLFIENEINNVINKYDSTTIKNIIFKADDNLPDEYKDKYGITDSRKEFIYRVIDRRVKNLNNI